MSGYIEHHRNSLKRIARHDDQDCSKESILNMMDRFVKTVSVMDDTILIPSRLMDRQVGDATDDVPKGASNGSPNKSNSQTSLNSHHNHHHHHHSHHHSHHKKKASVQESLNASSLFTVYTMLNKMKTDLLWGRNQDMAEEALALENGSKPVAVAPTTEITVSAPATAAVPVPASSAATTTTTKAEEAKGHVRRPSTASMASSNSSTASTISDDSESEISNENDSGIESENQRNADKSEELAKQFRMHLTGLYRTLEQMTEAANYLTARYQNDVGQV